MVIVFCNYYYGGQGSRWRGSYSCMFCDFNQMSVTDKKGNILSLTTGLLG